ncbi:ThiF family adenylyltransferase [Chryseobacterium gotjawalense]|uniref:ThiF family adenylyltransferase n=1 Tax=Chryseobacterium gotjawalense TaxID=3042315 RepID=A0ABY8RBX3_9FLAO|nr:ThiF family adenylyltransferase [Chryseobacterium sp. wdc7]WHF51460.1 ThiF family adenylyltransferase [Chryseobacterium sp. wdc7]
MNRYLRNRIYISTADQKKIKNYSLLIAGSGIGSNIAECALRTGFEKICVVDGDLIEDSNLNRQNYTETQIGTPKAEALYDRLKSINSRAEISFMNRFITRDQMPEVAKFKAAINALDFQDEIPVVFDQLCLKNGLPVVHPYNLGWGSMVTVLTPDSPPLTSIGKTENLNELEVVEYAASYRRFWQKPERWLEEILSQYKLENSDLPPPQLAIGSWYAAAMCTHLLVKMATGKFYKKFPEFYLCSLFSEEVLQDTAFL